MVNFHDPAQVAGDFCAYPSPYDSGTVQSIESVGFITVAVVELWHIVDGLYMCVLHGTSHANIQVLHGLTVHFYLQLGVRHQH
jgi:hypothetical protein